MSQTERVTRPKFLTLRPSNYTLFRASAPHLPMWEVDDMYGLTLVFASEHVDQTSERIEINAFSDAVLKKLLVIGPDGFAEIREVIAVDSSTDSPADTRTA